MTNWQTMTRTGSRGLAVALMLAISACDMFNVKNPTDLTEEDINDPQMISALANSAEGNVSLSYDNAVSAGGLPGDGVINASTNQTDLNLDRGKLDGFIETTEGLYDDMAAARWAAREATRRLRELLDSPDTDARVAHSIYWDAIAGITLADLYKGVTFDGGPSRTPVEVYQEVLDQLDQVAQIAGAADDQLYVAAAHGTKARVYRQLYFEQGEQLDLLQEASQEAEAALAAMPDFRLDIHFQQPGSENGLFRSLDQVQQVVMGTTYAYMRDPVSGEFDPRVQHTSSRGTGVFGDSLYAQLKYPDANADIPVSRWQEASLIIAEYRLESSDLAHAVDRINDVREAANLPDFSSSDADSILAQLIYERKAEFWLELRRWPDMRNYGIVPERWFPDEKERGVKGRRFDISLREQLANDNLGG